VWRKQDESKASASSSEVVVPAKAEPTVVTPVTSVAHAPAAPATLARESSYSAGHLTGGIKIKGEITGREDLLIDGEVHGQIRISDARVTIGSNGRLTANVEAREIMVRGKVKGDLHARDRVQIGPSGGVIGDVVTRFLSVEEGAEIRGNVDTTRGEERPAARVKTGAASTPEARPVPMQARGQSKESTQSA
jgi:cytoskeletal protein CcmA (bactofilin family)